MEQFSYSSSTLKQLKKLNQCRLFLQIHTLSDISNGQITYFDKIYYDVHQDKYGLLKDNQYQNNVNSGVRTSENDSKVIINQPIFTNLVNGQITAKTIGHISIIRNHIDFSLKVPLARSRKNLNDCTHKKE